MYPWNKEERDDEVEGGPKKVSISLRWKRTYKWKIADEFYFSSSYALELSVDKKGERIQDYEKLTPATLVYERISEVVSSYSTHLLLPHIPLWFSMTFIRHVSVKRNKTWDLAGKASGHHIRITFILRQVCCWSFHFIPLDVVLLLRRKTIKQSQNVKYEKKSWKKSERCRENSQK